MILSVNRDYFHVQEIELVLAASIIRVAQRRG
jgi:hypothetical protein